MRRSFAVIMATCLAAAIATPANTQTIQSNLWVTNGTVNALASSGSTLYVGGQFTRLSPPTGGYVPLDNTTGAISGPNPSVDGTVNVSIPDGSGGRFIGGYFAHVQGQPHSNVAHIDAGGNVSAWNPGEINGSISALAIDYASPGVLYMGGYFSLVNGVIVSSLAAVDASTGAVTSWQPHVDGAVNALGALHGVVYIGGSFYHLMGQPRQNLGAVDAGGSLTTWAPDANAFVDAIVTFASPPPFQNNVTIFVGGEFTSLAGQARYAIGSIDGSGVPTAWSPNGDHVVKCIALAYTRKGFIASVYAGGTFDQVGAQPRQHLARLDPTTGSADVTWSPEPDGDVNSIAFDGTNLYVGGVFDSIGGASRHCLASVDAVTGVATAWNPSPNDVVNTVDLGAGVAFAGGNFTGLGGVLRTNLAAINTSTGMATTWNPGADGPVLALAANGSTVYVGGSFGTAGNEQRQNIAAIDGGGHATGWMPQANGAVTALTIVGGTVVTGGSFFQICGKIIPFLAAIDAVADTARELAFQLTGQSINALATDGSTLYVGGRFTNINSQPRSSLAALSVALGMSPWHPLLAGGTFGSPEVHAVAAGGGMIMAGGDFEQVGGSFFNDLAAFDEGTGNLIIWDISTEGPVNALIASGNTIFVGGAFHHLGSVARSCLAAVDTRSFSILPWDPSALNVVKALALVGSTPYAGGDFLGMGGSPHGHLAGILGAITVVGDVVRPPSRSLQLSANPSRGPLGLHFAMAEAAVDAEADVFDTNGRMLRRIDAGPLGAGEHQLTWDGRDNAGHVAAPGVYFIRVHAGALEESAKAVRLR